MWGEVRWVSFSTVQVEACLSSMQLQPQASQLQKQRWQGMHHHQNQHGPELQGQEDVVEAEDPSLVNHLQLLQSLSMWSQSHPLQDVHRWSGSMIWREAWPIASNLEKRLCRRRRPGFKTEDWIDWTVQCALWRLLTTFGNLLIRHFFWNLLSDELIQLRSRSTRDTCWSEWHMQFHWDSTT